MKRVAAASTLGALFVCVSNAALCSDPQFSDFYTFLLAQTVACEDATGVTLDAPLTSAQIQNICGECTLLAQETANKTFFPNCTVYTNERTELTNVLTLYSSFFACSDEKSSGSSSNSSSSGSAGIGDAVGTPQATAPYTSALPPGAFFFHSGFCCVAPRVLSEIHISFIENLGASMSIGLIAGIIIGVLAAVLILVLFVRHQKRKNAAGPKFVAQLLSPASSYPDSSTNQSNTIGSGTGNKSNASSHQGFPPQGGLWEDGEIIAARIPKEKVRSHALLSRGGYGEVHRGVYNDQQVAIKTLLPETRKNLKQINAFLAEVKLMASLEHERIVQFIGVAWDSLNDLCVVSEYMEGGDLRGLLTRFEDVEHRPHGFDHDKVKIALHIAHALTYLHSLQPVVLHRDLKSKNILLDNQLNAKLTDFGVSRERIDSTMTAGVGTSLWMTPEVMMGEYYDGKADIFSFGIVLSELDSHVLPYTQAKESESGRRLPDTAVLQLVSLGRLRVEFSSEALPEIVALAHACVAVAPQDRPAASEVLYKLHNMHREMVVSL
ncbi:Tkl protein kinase, partial [Globisporangium splendens]